MRFTEIALRFWQYRQGTLIELQERYHDNKIDKSLAYLRKAIVVFLLDLR